MYEDAVQATHAEHSSGLVYTAELVPEHTSGGHLELSHHAANST